MGVIFTPIEGWRYMFGVALIPALVLLIGMFGLPEKAIPPNRLVTTIADAISEVRDSFEVGGACLAVPGLTLAVENKVVFSPNLHEIEDIPLDEEMGTA